MWQVDNEATVLSRLIIFHACNLPLLDVCFILKYTDHGSILSNVKFMSFYRYSQYTCESFLM